MTGQQLLSFRPDDLELLGITKIGHQEIILEGVEHLRNIVSFYIEWLYTLSNFYWNYLWLIRETCSKKIVVFKILGLVVPWTIYPMVIEKLNTPISEWIKNCSFILKNNFHIKTIFFLANQFINKSVCFIQFFAILLHCINKWKIFNYQQTFFTNKNKNYIWHGC